MRWRCDERQPVEEESMCSFLVLSPRAYRDLRSRVGAGVGGVRKRAGIEEPFHGARAWTSGHRLLQVLLLLPRLPRPPLHPTYQQEAELKSACPLSNARRGQVTPPADCRRGRHGGWVCCNHDCPAGDPSRTVIVRMSGKDRIEIFPSRM